MAGALRRTMEYLGLVDPDEQYDDYAEELEPEAPVARRHASQGNTVTLRPESRGDVRFETRLAPVTEAPRATRAPEPVFEDAAPYRITTMHPRNYNEAKQIGELVRSGVPVIMNVTDMDDADARRLVDFGAGLTFGLFGTIERVTNKVFLLSPSNVSVSAEDKRLIAEGGFFNQS